MSEDTGVHYGAKNTVFLDLFSIPEYRLQMFQALHPEMTDVTEDEIKLVTLNPVLCDLHRRSGFTADRRRPQKKPSGYVRTLMY